jgi:hypothetical protein
LSGSDAPTYSGTGRDSGGEDPCSALKLTRALEGPVPGVADEVVVGDVVLLELRTGPPSIVAAVDRQSRDVGSILPTQRLLQCLENGYPFEAVVDVVNGGQVLMTVQARSQ